MKIDDFTGFYWNGHHTSEWNIKVVSSSDRYDSRFLSDISNNFTDIPGADGQYYHNSNFGPKKWTCNIAFDKITEINKREIENWLSSKELSDLIFDEIPFKAYSCKLESQPSITWLCFDEPKTTKNRKEPRIYKGEGTLNFIAPFPYAHNARKINEDGTTGEPLKYLNDIEFLKNHSKFKKYTYLLSKSGGSTIHLHNSRSVLDLDEIRGNTTQLFEVNEQGYSFGLYYDLISGYFGTPSTLNDNLKDIPGYLNINLNDISNNTDDVNGIDYTYVNNLSLSDGTAWLTLGWQEGDTTSAATFDKVGSYYDKIYYDKNSDTYKLEKNTIRLSASPFGNTDLNCDTYFALKKEGNTEKTQFQLWEQMSELQPADLDSMELTFNISNSDFENIILSSNLDLKTNYYRHREIEYDPITMQYKEYEVGDFISKYTETEDDTKNNNLTLTFKGNFYNNEKIINTINSETDNSNFFSFLKTYIKNSKDLGEEVINNNDSFSVFEKVNDGNPLLMTQFDFNDEYEFYHINIEKLNNIFNTFENNKLKDDLLAAGQMQLLMPSKNYMTVSLFIRSSDADDDVNNLWSFKLRKDVMGSSSWQDLNGNPLDLFNSSNANTDVSAAELTNEVIFKEYETLYENIDEWGRASGLKQESLITPNLDIFGQSVEYDIPCGMQDPQNFKYDYYYFPVYNAGDIESPFKLKIDFMDTTHPDSTGASYGPVWGDYQYQILLRQVNDNLFKNNPEKFGDINSTLPNNQKPINNLFELVKGKKYIINNDIVGYYQDFYNNGTTYKVRFLNNNGESFEVDWGTPINSYSIINSSDSTIGYTLLGNFTLDFSANNDNNKIKEIISAYVENINLSKFFRTSIEIDSQKQSINWIIENTNGNITAKDNITTNLKQIYPANFMLTDGEIFSIPPKLDNLQLIIYTGINGKIIDGNRDRTTITYPYLYY